MSHGVMELMVHLMHVIVILRDEIGIADGLCLIRLIALLMILSNNTVGALKYKILS